MRSLSVRTQHWHRECEFCIFRTVGKKSDGHHLKNPLAGKQFAALALVLAKLRIEYATQLCSSSSARLGYTKYKLIYKSKNDLGVVLS